MSQADELSEPWMEGIFSNSMSSSSPLHVRSHDSKSSLGQNQRPTTHASCPQHLKQSENPLEPWAYGHFIATSHHREARPMDFDDDLPE